MKKTILLLFCVSVLLNANAQTVFVSTTPENRKVVLEEYTGILCVNCPDGHRIANAIAAAHPEEIFLMNIHQGGFASDIYTTQWGDALANQYNVTAYPIGTLNRGASLVTKERWDSVANIVFSTPSPLNIAAHATIDALSRVLTVQVQVYYTSASETASNFLHVAILQDNVLGEQTGMIYNPAQITANGEYKHMHILRELITGQWGTELRVEGQSVIPASTLFDTTFTYIIPQQLGYPNPIDALIEDLNIIAFVSMDHKGIYTGTSAEIEYTNVSSDFSVTCKSINFVDELGCNNLVTPTLTLRNMSSTPMLSMDINYTGNTEPYHWTGTLGMFDMTDIVLPSSTIVLGEDVTFEFDITKFNDMPVVMGDLLATATHNKPLTKTSTFGIPILQLKQDRNGQEITWSLYDVNGGLIQEGGPYEQLTSGSTQTHNIPLNNIQTDGCYIFEIRDAGGNGINSGTGTGNYKIVGQDGAILVNSNGKYDAGEMHDFYLQSVGLEDMNASVDYISIYPNPTKDNATLEISLMEATNIQIAITDILGKEMINYGRRSLFAGKNTININTLSLKGGIYFVRIITEKGVSIHKIIIER
ncbi:MAG: T9SS type A sorting domain-containing protein [Bacteroidales bacterium]|jgi:hypothetical protein|nr:T9SS type A sorting domain-containing protein [Bacteroidales bacterium]